MSWDWQGNVSSHIMWSCRVIIADDSPYILNMMIDITPLPLSLSTRRRRVHLKMDLLEMGIMDMEYKEVEVGAEEEVEGKHPFTVIQHQL